MSSRKYDEWMNAKEHYTIAQNLTREFPQFSKYMGSDEGLAKMIAQIEVMLNHPKEYELSKEDIADLTLTQEMYIEQNRAAFASGAKTDNLTKVSLPLPAEEKKKADGSK